MLSKNQFFDWDRNCQPSKKDEHSSARNIFSLFVGRRRRSRSNIIRQFLQSVIILLLLLFFSLSSLNTSGTREFRSNTRISYIGVFDRRTFPYLLFIPWEILISFPLLLLLFLHPLVRILLSSVAARLVSSTYFIKLPISNDKVDANNNLRREIFEQFSSKRKHSTSSLMRARSRTELDTRQRVVPLGTCLPSQTELDIDHQRTGHVSWIKRYSFSSCFSFPIVLIS